MIRALRTSLCLLMLLTLLLGGVYPLLVTVFAQVLFPHRANGSLIVQNEKIIGSELLGQEFNGEKYFLGRLSATTPPYNAAGSGGSNFSAANPKLLEAAAARLKALKATDHGAVPIELVTASASGLDPHLSLAAIDYQVARVAKARKMKEEDVQALVAQHTVGRRFSLSGHPYVNVLMLNMTLDKDLGSGIGDSGKKK